MLGFHLQGLCGTIGVSIRVTRSTVRTGGIGGAGMHGNTPAYASGVPIRRRGRDVSDSVRKRSIEVEFIVSRTGDRNRRVGQVNIHV